MSKKYLIIFIIAAIAILGVVFGLFIKIGDFFNIKEAFCKGVEIASETAKYERFCYKDSDCMKTRYSYRCCDSCYLDAVNGIAESQRQDWNKKNCKNARCNPVLCAKPIRIVPVCVFNQCVLQ